MATPLVPDALPYRPAPLAAEPLSYSAYRNLRNSPKGIDWPLGLHTTLDEQAFSEKVDDLPFGMIYVAEIHGPARFKSYIIETDYTVRGYSAKKKRSKEASSQLVVCRQYPCLVFTTDQQAGIRAMVNYDYPILKYTGIPGFAVEQFHVGARTFFDSPFKTVFSVMPTKDIPFAAPLSFGHVAIGFPIVTLSAFVVFCLVSGIRCAFCLSSCA